MKLTGVQWVLLVSTLITAVLHIVLVVAWEELVWQALFILNGVGYIALLVGILWPPDFLKGLRTPIHLAMMAFAAVTIVGYFAVNGIKVDFLGWLTKIAEVAVIATAYLNWRRN